MQLYLSPIDTCLDADEAPTGNFTISYAKIYSRLCGYASFWCTYLRTAECSLLNLAPCNIARRADHFPSHYIFVSLSLTHTHTRTDKQILRGEETLLLYFLVGNNPHFESYLHSRSNDLDQLASRLWFWFENVYPRHRR